MSGLKILGSICDELKKGLIRVGDDISSDDYLLLQKLCSNILGEPTYYEYIKSN